MAGRPRLRMTSSRSCWPIARWRKRRTSTPSTGILRSLGAREAHSGDIRAAVGEGGGDSLVVGAFADASTPRRFAWEPRASRTGHRPGLRRQRRASGALPRSISRASDSSGRRFAASAVRCGRHSQQRRMHQGPDADSNTVACCAGISPSHDIAIRMHSC